jgi:hypothetical protein
MATTGYGVAFPSPALIVCAHPDYRGNPIAAPSDYQRRWGRSGGGGTGTIAQASWATIPPAGFVACTDFYGPDYDPGARTISQACFSQDCVIQASIVQPNVWNDQGSGASDDGSIWGIDDGSGGPWYSFVAQSGYGPPASAWRLNPDIIEMI